MSYLMIPICECRGPAFAAEAPVDSLLQSGCPDGVAAEVHDLDDNGELAKYFYTVWPNQNPFPNEPTSFSFIRFFCLSDPDAPTFDDCGEPVGGDQYIARSCDGSQPDVGLDKDIYDARPPGTQTWQKQVDGQTVCYTVIERDTQLEHDPSLVPAPESCDDPPCVFDDEFVLGVACNGGAQDIVLDVRDFENLSCPAGRELIAYTANQCTCSTGEPGTIVHTFRITDTPASGPATPSVGYRCVIEGLCAAGGIRDGVCVCGGADLPGGRPGDLVIPDQAQGPGGPDPRIAAAEAHMARDPMRRCKGCGQ